MYSYNFTGLYIGYIHLKARIFSCFELNNCKESIKAHEVYIIPWYTLINFSQLLNVSQ